MTLHRHRNARERNAAPQCAVPAGAPPREPARTDREPPRADIESRTREIGREIFARAAALAPGVLHGAWWQERLLEWSMRDPELRTQLFRFVDVLPSLHGTSAVAAHLREYLRHDGHSLPAPLHLATVIGGPHSPARWLTAAAARRQVRALAHRFVAGETTAKAAETVRRLRRQGMACTIDVLGEETTSEAQADRYAARYAELIEALAAAAAHWPAVAQIDTGPRGALPRVNVSLKLSSLDSHFDAIAPARALAVVGGRLRGILRLARARGAYVWVDMEQYARKDLIIEIFTSILEEDEFRDDGDVGIVLQAYLRDAERDLNRLLDWARRRGQPIGIRLVRGAYWEAETVLAAQRGWPCPVFEHKHETDAAYERLARLLLANRRWLDPAIATHNIRSIAHALAHMEAIGAPANEVEIQMLYGMSEPLQKALVERGLRVRVYAPYGALIPGMGYLIRRLLENTSNESFLRQSFAAHVPIDELLEDPAAAPAAPAAQSPPGPRAVRGFANEPFTDFAVAANRDRMAAALRTVRARCGGFSPLYIGGVPRETARVLESRDPSDPSFLVGRTACAGTAQADEAVCRAQEAERQWRLTSAAERAAVLERLAEKMAAGRFELAALMVIEAGKPWREADADVAEAIDYCRFYAAQMRELDRPRRRDVPGEENVLVYEPRGVAVVIAPWNFPLAILTGMATAALVTGNAVILKPAEQTPIVAGRLYHMLCEAGLPGGVAAFLPGLGEEVGAHLVAHPGVDLIAFTGSREVGLGIIEAAARPVPGQRSIKHVVAEMGGKNAILVDEDADLDEAVRGVALSAFGYAGQKCSACSRVIVVRAAHEELRRRLVETALSLPVGRADDPATVVGPLIDAEALQRVRRYIEIGRQEAELICEAPAPPGAGYLVGPVVFDRVPPQARIAQEEIFGPVLAMIVAESFDEAIAISNGTSFALTGGVYSRSPAHIATARRELRVGNLYINRPITGALVDRQPFGGRGLSGSGAKAGGPDYLRQFVEAKTISENTMRHGFTPDVGSTAGQP